MKSIRTRRTLVLAMVTGIILSSQGVRAEEGPNIYYKDGTHIDSADGNNTLTIQGRFAARFTETLNKNAESTDSFSIPRGEIRLEGNVLNPRLKYGFEMNLSTRAASSTATVCLNTGGTATANCPGGTTSVVTSPTTTGLASLNDFYLDWTPIDSVGIKFGQFKVPFLMQQLTSSTKQQFVDRSLGTGFFDLARDIGATIHGDILNYHANYNVFAMNGDGANSNNLNKSLLAGTRIEFPIIGQYKPIESDVDYSESPNAGVGVAYVLNKRPSTIQTNIPANTFTSHATFDAGYKYHGLSFQTALMITRAHSGVNLTNWGYNTQVGYFIVPKKIELAVRGSSGIFSGAIPNQYEYAAGFNYFFKGHSIKWQNDFAVLRNTRSGAGFVNDERIRTQAQVVF